MHVVHGLVNVGKVIEANELVEWKAALFVQFDQFWNKDLRHAVSLMNASYRAAAPHKVQDVGMYIGAGNCVYQSAYAKSGQRRNGLLD